MTWVRPHGATWQAGACPAEDEPLPTRGRGLPDPAVLHAARHGDLRAIEAVLEHCRAGLCRTARRHCPAGSDPEDAVQEAMLLIYRHITGLRSNEAFPAWVAAIVRRVCQRLALRQLPLTEEIVEDTLVGSDEALALGYDLAQAFADLPDTYRQAVILRDVEEFALTEIAEVLKLSLETTKNRIHRGRKRLRSYLGG